MAGEISLFAVQDRGTHALLNGLGYHRVQWVGDTRFDRVLELSHTPFENSVLESFTGHLQAQNGRISRPVLVAGSTWDADDRLLVQALEAQRLSALNNPAERRPSKIPPSGFTKTRPIAQGPVLFQSL
jgi:3-deoxy-D-manno-octulosonic-acid transferase